MTSGVALSSAQLDILSRPLIGIVQDYFENEVNVQAYRKWFREKYGYEPEDFIDGKSNTYSNAQRG